MELTDGCYSEGDSQGLPGFIHPRVLGIPIICFKKKLHSQRKKEKKDTQYMLSSCCGFVCVYLSFVMFFSLCSLLGHVVLFSSIEFGGLGLCTFIGLFCDLLPVPRRLFHGSRPKAH